MTRFTGLLIGLALLVFAAGCGQHPREAQIEVKGSNDPLAAPRSLLQRYAQGQPITSEVTSFPHMVESVRKVDPRRADILEKGLEELQKAPPASRPARAKELLGKIQPSMKP